MNDTALPRRTVLTFLFGWLDCYQGAHKGMDTDPAMAKPDWFRVMPFLLLHLSCLAVFLPGVGWSWPAVAFAFALYWIRMFGITGVYHRYFSHRTYKTSRVFQFILALIGASAVQRGPLWWAAHHRHHHRHSDEPSDIHSPIQRGFWWSHMFWFLTGNNYRTRTENIPDYAKFPELVLLDRFDTLIPILTGAGAFFLGIWISPAGVVHPGGQFLTWWAISTICVAHGTFTINSLSHVWGKRVFQTTDTSRNNPWLAIVTMGEGWHNNHHHFQSSARQGFYWWQVDMSYYVLKSMSVVGLVWDLKPVPEKVLAEGRAKRGSMEAAIQNPAADPASAATSSPAMAEAASAAS